MSIIAQFNASCDWCGATCKHSGADLQGAVTMAISLGWRVDPTSHVCRACIDKSKSARADKDKEQS